MTTAQAQVLLFMWQFYLRNDQLPPLQVISTQQGWNSPNSADHCTRQLQAKGYLERNELGKWRFTPEGRAFCQARAAA